MSRLNIENLTPDSDFFQSKTVYKKDALASPGNTYLISIELPLNEDKPEEVYMFDVFYSIANHGFVLLCQQDLFASFKFSYDYLEELANTSNINGYRHIMNHYLQKLPEFNKIKNTNDVLQESKEV